MDYLPPGRVAEDRRRAVSAIRHSRRSRTILGGDATVGATSLPMPSCSTGRLDATEARNRHCLGGDEADTFTATIVLTVHARRWSAKELARFLKRHREFFIGGPAGKEGLLLEIRS